MRKSLGIRPRIVPGILPPTMALPLFSLWINILMTSTLYAIQKYTSLHESAHDITIELLFYLAILMYDRKETSENTLENDQH